MPLSPEEIAAAGKMHKFVREYERGGLPTVCLGALGLVAVAASIWWINASGPRWKDVALGWILAMLFGMGVGQVARRLRYRHSRIMLGILERDHPDELPWLKEEKAEAGVKSRLAAERGLQSS